MIKKMAQDTILAIDDYVNFLLDINKLEKKQIMKLFVKKLVNTSN